MAPRKAARVYLIDAPVYVFRAYFSLPETMADAAGRPINAIYGFARFLADLRRRVGPDAVLMAAFDESLTTSFRNRIYPAYKANRPPAPESLKQQFARVRELCRVLGVPEHADGEFEADDIIGHWVDEALKSGRQATVVSRDKDLTQLVNERVDWWDFAGDVRLGPMGVREKMGVDPHQVADYLALMGDSVDNIPGVRGVGPKAAAALLDAFGTLNAVYDQIEGVAELPVRGAKSLQKKLQAGESEARMSRELTGILASCPGSPPLPARLEPADISHVTQHLASEGLGENLLGALRVFSD